MEAEEGVDPKGEGEEEVVGGVVVAGGMVQRELRRKMEQAAVMLQEDTEDEEAEVIKRDQSPREIEHGKKRTNRAQDKAAMIVKWLEEEAEGLNKRCMRLRYPVCLNVKIYSIEPPHRLILPNCIVRARFGGNTILLLKRALPLLCIPNTCRVE